MFKFDRVCGAVSYTGAPQDLPAAPFNQRLRSLRLSALATQESQIIAAAFSSSVNLYRIQPQGLSLVATRALEPSTIALAVTGVETVHAMLHAFTSQNCSVALQLWIIFLPDYSARPRGDPICLLKGGPATISLDVAHDPAARYALCPRTL